MPPSDVPGTPRRTEPPRSVAARLTLMALRADTPGGTRTSARRILLLPDPAPQPVASALRRLAARPKPLQCRATVRDGLLAVEATPLPPAIEPAGAELPIVEEPLPPGVRVATPEERQLFHYLREAHGPAIDHMPVVCAGAGAVLRTTVATVHAWERDHRLVADDGRSSMLGRAVHSLDATAVESEAARRAWLEARGVGFVPGAMLDGAAALLVFESTDEAPETTWRLRTEDSPAYFCDDCGRRRAEYRLVRRAAGREDIRLLCGPCEFLRDVVPGGPQRPWEWVLEQCEPDEATSSEEELQTFAALLARYQEKLGLPLRFEWAEFLRRHPPEA